MGAVFLISQLLILRTFLLVFQGNELYVGIVLGNWFMLEALGSWLWGKRAAGSPDPHASFVRVQVILSLLLPATLVAILAGRFLPGGSPWEVSSPVRILAVSWGLMFPLAVANGAAFVYGCKLLEHGRNARGRGPGKVYVLESAGACLGGVAFTFLLVGRLSAMETAFGLGCLNLFAALLLLRGKGRALRWTCSVLLVGFLAGLVLHPAGTLHRWSMQLRWLPFPLESTSDSIYGNITVLRMGGERVLVQNGIPAVTLPTPDLRALEERVHLPLLAHADPREVLLLGGGVGGGIAEALKHPVRKLTTLEIDPLLVRTVEEIFPSGARMERGDPRTESIVEDGRFFLRKSTGRYDVILVHLPDPATLQLNRFFTEEFFLLARDRLRPGGVLALALSGSSTYLGGELVRMNRCVRDTLLRVFPYVRVIPGERNLFLASGDPGLDSLDAQQLEDRIRERSLPTKVVQAGTLEYKMDPERERWLREELEAAPSGRINRDLSPALLSHVLAHRNAEVQPGWRKVALFLERIDAGVLLTALILLNFPLAAGLAAGGGGRSRALGYAIFTTGFAGMAVEMIVILSFQAVYGFLYQWIGILMAGFMAGLAVGAWWMTRALAGMVHGYRTFFLLEVAQAVVLFLAAWGLSPGNISYLREAGFAEAPAGFLLGVNLLMGILVGCEFPLAAGESGRDPGLPMVPVAGRLYALDLAGAWLGTFLAAVLLIPLLGFRYTLMLTGTLKAVALVSLCLAAFHGRRARG